MPLYPAPSSDLHAAIAVLDADARRDLVTRWAARATRQHVPREPADVPDFVEELLDAVRTALDHETGAARTVRAEWIEEEGRPGDEVPYTEAEERQETIWRVSAAGAAARTLAYLVHGERGFRDEVARQYADLATYGDVITSSTTYAALEAGTRYRVYTAFQDLDGRSHPWGESWRFFGYAIDPATCVVTLQVGDGIQLAPSGAPGLAIEVPPFHMPLAIFDGEARIRDPLQTLLVIDR